MRSETVHWRPCHRFGAAAALLFALTGCGDILTVDNPSSILDEDLNSESGIAALTAGVAGDFNAAFTGTAVWAALLSDELIHTGTAPAERNVSLGEVATEPADRKSVV